MVALYVSHNTQSKPLHPEIGSPHLPRNQTNPRSKDLVFYLLGCRVSAIAASKKKRFASYLEQWKPLAKKSPTPEFRCLHVKGRILRRSLEPLKTILLLIGV